MVNSNGIIQSHLSLTRMNQSRLILQPSVSLTDVGEIGPYHAFILYSAYNARTIFRTCSSVKASSDSRPNERAIRSRIPRDAKDRNTLLTVGLNFSRYAIFAAHNSTPLAFQQMVLAGRVW